MASLNRVHLIGNLGQDPELRYTPNQVAVCTLNIATTEYRTKEDGQREEQTTWHRVVVWNKQAENCSKYLTKGRPVYVEGKLQTRQWDDKTGNRRYTTEIVAQNIQFLGSGGASAGRDNQASQNNNSFGQQGGGASSNNNNYGPPSASFGSQDMPVMDPSLDDIPF